MNRAEASFNRILKEYGHDVLIVHSDKKVHCTCYDKVTGNADSSCPYCFGLGYVSLVVKKKTRSVDKNVSDTVIGNIQQFGDMTVSSRNYYFKKDDTIKEGDLVVEVEWRGERPIYTDGGIYEFRNIEPLRFTNGEISYLKASVKDKPVLKKIKGLNVVRRANQSTYQIAEERSDR